VKKVSITEAKSRLSALIDSLESGSPILIVDRGRPVARLGPVTLGGEGSEDGRRLRLLREGLVRVRRAPPSRRLFSDEPPRARPGASAVDALLEERRDARTRCHPWLVGRRPPADS
jgi:prevent-host-death family protein